MGAQVSIITRDFCEQHGYDIYPVKQMLHLEGMGGFSIPYLGYIEATVRIPPIKDYEECVPMLVLKSFSPFSLRGSHPAGHYVVVSGHGQDKGRGTHSCQ